MGLQSEDITVIMASAVPGGGPLYSPEGDGRPISACGCIQIRAVSRPSGTAAWRYLNMNTHTPRAQQHRQVQSLAVLAMFTAILFLLTFTPIGMIDLPIIKATVLHVPVIIGALLLGPKKGAFLGGMFGLASLLKNTLVPNLSSFAFSPLIPVPGLDRGSPWALVVCFVPRILVGVTPWLVYTLLQALSRRQGSVLQAGSMALSAVVGAFTNTALVMGLIALLFRDAYAAAQGIPVEAVLGFILGIVAANGVPEAIVAAILVPAVCIPMGKALKLNRAPLAAREPV